MNSAFALITFLTFIASACPTEVFPAEEFRSYDGHQVISTKATTKEQFQFLQSLVSDNNELDFWTQPGLNLETDIMIKSSYELESLQKSFTSFDLPWKVKIPNLGRLIVQEQKSLRSNAFQTMTWDNYHPWETMEPWIQGLNASTIAEVTVVGRSSENRTIYMVKVSTGPGTAGSPKKAIFIDANIHAREWIASATSTYILNELIFNTQAYKDILDEVDFYLIPQANPDGYCYTHTTDRMWRKTRSVNVGSECRGCDPNRNFEFMWGGEMTSSDPCSDNYHGSEPWSEPEVRAIRDAIRSIQRGGQPIQAYIALHSYGNLWLLSWGFTQKAYPADYPELLEWGQSSIEKIQAVHGTPFTTGQGADIFYGVGGASDDHAKLEGIKYATTLELRDALDGDYGFILPGDQIIPTAEEAWAGIQETARIISKKENTTESFGIKLIAQNPLYLTLLAATIIFIVLE